MSAAASFAPASAGLPAGGAASGAFTPTNFASAFVTPGYDVGSTPFGRALSRGATTSDSGSGGDDEPTTTEDSGTNTDGDSGDDGFGGTYWWTEVDTWDIVNTTDSAGNSSYTEHDVYTYVFHESGTTPDGINYVMDYTTTTTYDASRQNDADGTGHSTSSQVTDASYQDHSDDGLGDTYDDDGTNHATTRPGTSTSPTPATRSRSADRTNGPTFKQTACLRWNEARHPGGRLGCGPSRVSIQSTFTVAIPRLKSERPERRRWPIRPR